MTCIAVLSPDVVEIASQYGVGSLNVSLSNGAVVTSYHGDQGIASMYGIRRTSMWASACRASSALPRATSLYNAW